MMELAAMASATSAASAYNYYVGSYFRRSSVLGSYRVYMTTTFRDTTDPSVIGSTQVMNILSCAGGLPGPNGPTYSGYIYQIHANLISNGSFAIVAEQRYAETQRWAKTSFRNWPYTTYATQLVMKYAGSQVVSYYLVFNTQQDYNNGNPSYKEGWVAPSTKPLESYFLVGTYQYSGNYLLKYFQSGVESEQQIADNQNKLVARQWEMSYLHPIDGKWWYEPARACQGSTSWISVYGGNPYRVGGYTYYGVWAAIQNLPKGDEIYWRWNGLTTPDELNLWTSSGNTPGPKQDYNP